MKNVFVTGMGIISAIGDGVVENLNNLRKGKTGIARAKFLDSKYSETHYFAEVKISNDDLKKKLDIDNFYGFTRTDYLAFIAFKQAIDDAGLSSEEVSSRETAFITASTIGGMCMTDQLYQDANLMTPEGSEYIGSYPGNSHSLKVAKEYGLSGIVDTINTACSSSANAIMLGAKLIQLGKAKRAIVGGTDSLGKFTINGFNALQIMSEESCKPFDDNRSGLTLGEGAAYLILESEEVAKEKNKYARVLGYGNSNDAYHASSLSEDAVGVIEAMSKALSSASLDSSSIDYINTHGTATDNNDLTELTGMNEIFGDVPPFNSTKSYTGHTLAAAGVIEAVYSILSIEHQELYPSLNCEVPISTYNRLPIEKYRSEYKINNVLSNSFGFGGNCTSLVFGQPHLN